MRKASAIIAAVFGVALALCPRAARAQAYTPAKIWYQPSSGTFHAVSNGVDQAIGSGGSGTVTTFGVSPTGLLGPVFSCTVANPSTTPTLTCTISSQTANTVFAAPNGSSGSPTFRALVAGDIPTLNYAGNSGSAIATLVQSLTGCTTATYVFTPQASDCVAPSSGTGTVTDSTGSTTPNQVALSTTTAHQIAYDANFTDNAGAVTVKSLTAGTGASACGSTASGGMCNTEAASTGFTATAGQDYVRADSTAHQYKVSLNGGAEFVSLMNYSAAAPPALGGTTPAAGTFTALTGTTINTATHCAAAGSAANPSVASCSAAAAGFFSCATNASTGTCTIDTTAVTANSVIQVEPDDSLGTALSVTCNTAMDTGLTAPRVGARVAGTSFTINLGTFSTNPECFSYIIVN